MKAIKIIFLLVIFFISCQNTPKGDQMSISGHWESEAMTTSIEELGEVKIELNFKDSLCLFKPFHQEFTPFQIEENKIIIGAVTSDREEDYVFKFRNKTDSTMILEAGNVFTLLTLEFFEYGELSRVPLRKIE